jgi:hypothetical protein
MKTNLLFLVVFLLAASCDLLKSDAKDSDSIGGSTDIPINKVGTTFANNVVAGFTSYQGNIAITSVTNGVTTVQFKAAIPANVPILQGIKPKYKDSSGNLVCEGKFKMTDEGILDYNNKDHKPFVLVKYDGKVGDIYKLEKSDGTVIEREIVRKSESDDFYWNGMIIKTIDVEQSSNIPGVANITYFCNHKFGVVAVRVNMEDGTKPQLNLVPSQY